MALLPGYSSCVFQCCTTASLASTTVTCRLKPQLAGLQVHPATPPLAICRASSENGSSVLPGEEAGQQVFKDESNGVVCYYDEHGDVTCEGWDEGPHFQPDPQDPKLRRRRKFTPRSDVQSRSGVEAVRFENVKGRMGNSLGEVANESLESSEL